MKNKDGTQFKLRGPNPITKEQELWNEDVEYHNIAWKPTFVEQVSVVQEVIEDEKEVPPLPSEKIEEKIIPPEVSEKPENKPLSDKVEKSIVIMHCLPAEENTKQDDLYGEVYSKTGYGEKIMFEAAVVDVNDLMMRIWTTYQLTKGSVIYPSRYRDGRKYGQLRWWKVSSLDPLENGILANCVISDYQPAFS